MVSAIAALTAAVYAVAMFVRNRCCSEKLVVSQV
jgi:hypothetical protein